jgi:hypothetical protein
MRLLATAVSIAMICTSCMYTIHMVHTQGQAEDVIDDNDSPDVKTDANVQIPAVGL